MRLLKKIVRAPDTRLCQKVTDVNARFHSFLKVLEIISIAHVCVWGWPALCRNCDPSGLIDYGNKAGL